MKKRVIIATIATMALIAVSMLVVDSGVLLIRGERVSFEGDGVVLQGMLALPRWHDSPYPAAVIVHGSGRTTARDMRAYARRLVPHGMAVLMYDKRGVGGSGGDYSVIGVDDSELLLGRLAGDAAAAVRHLSARADIDADRIGLVGGSQAGWIMPLAAVRSDDVAFIVAISGPAVTYGQEIHYSRLTGDDPGSFTALDDAEIERRFAEFDGPHGYDPMPDLESLEAPSLWILGGRDRSVPTAATVENLERLDRDRPGRFTVRVHPAGDHSIRDADTGRPIDYWPEAREWLRDGGFLPP